MSSNLYAIPRLKLLAYEPSHYGLLLAPVFLFFILKILTGKSGHPLILAAGIGIPLLLSFSFGIIGAMIATLLIGSLAHLHKFPVNSRRMLIYSVYFPGYRDWLPVDSSGLDNPIFYPGWKYPHRGRQLHKRQAGLFLHVCQRPGTPA